MEARTTWIAATAALLLAIISVARVGISFETVGDTIFTVAAIFFILAMVAILLSVALKRVRVRRGRMHAD